MNTNKKKVAIFKRTEGNFSYSYGQFIASSFSKWAAVRRDNDVIPYFFDFYKILPEDEQKLITITKTNQS